MESYLTVDGLRAGLVVVFAVGQAVMGSWPDWRKWPETIATRSASLCNPLVPIEWAFAIWGPIFASCIAFALWQALPNNLNDPLLRSIGWLAAAMFAGNILWEYYVPKRTLDFVSVAVIVVELGLLLTILFKIAGVAGELDSTRFWLVYAPFQLFAGWVTAATFVNTASALQNAGYKIGTVPSLVMITAAGALATVVAAMTGGLIYALAVAWALFGIVIANTVRDRNPPVAVLAALVTPVVIGAVLVP